MQVKSLIDACMSSHSSARQSEIRAWEEEIVACEHALLLKQFNFETGPIAESGTTGQFLYMGRKLTQARLSTLHFL